MICAHFGWSLEYVNGLSLQQITRIVKYVIRNPHDKGTQLVTSRLLQSMTTSKIKLHEIVPHLVDAPKPKVLSDKKRSKILMSIR